jgi:hypothetical protein
VKIPGLELPTEWALQAALSYANVLFPPTGSTMDFSRPAVVYPYRVVLPSGSANDAVRPMTLVYVYDMVSPSGSKVFRSRSRL